MNRFILIVMAACSLLWVSVCLASGDDPQSQKDHAALQGEWTAVSAESNGEPPPPGLLDRMKFVFSGDKLTLAGNQGTFKLDATTTPRQIDIAGKTVRQVGIYKLNGDKLTLCTGLADDRPKEFRTRPGTNYTMFVLSRKR